MTGLPRQGVILAAGLGTRLRPVTTTTPKALVPFFGRPLLDHSAMHLVRAGARRVAVNAHHHAEQVLRHVEEVLGPTYPHVAWEVSLEPDLLGTGGALARLRGWLGTEPFYVVNADAVFAQPLELLGAAHGASGADATLMVSRDPAYAALRFVAADAGGRLEGIGCAPVAAGAVFCGVHVAGPRLLATLPDGSSCVIGSGYRPMLTSGADLRVFLTDAPWADTGTPEQYVDAHRRFWPLREDLERMRRDAEAATGPTARCT